MTTREYLNIHRKRALLLALPGISVFVGGMVFASGAVVIGGFMILFSGLLYMAYGGRCLHCGQKLGQMFYQKGGPFWSISRNLRFCPYCGKSIDDDPAKTPSAEQAKG